MRDIEIEDEITSKKRNFSRFFNKMEQAYLAGLRTLALVAATLLLLYAVWLGVTGLYKISLNADAIKEVPATVSTEDITNIDVKSAQAREAEAPDPFKIQRAFYQDFQKRYFNLYQTKFAPFLQPDDTKTTEQDFTSEFVHLGDRLEAIKQGELNFETDKADLEALLTGITGAVGAKVSQDRLRAYRAAKKTSVSRTVTSMKTERYCGYYGYYIEQCISWDTREVPVKSVVTEMKLPDGIISPSDLFAAYHEKYINTLTSRRTENAATAARAKSEIIQGNAIGSENLWTGMKVVGFFITLMFLFLLIALERHQRKIAQTRES